MTIKDRILLELKDINYAYNNSMMYNTIKNMLDGMEEEIRLSTENKIIQEIQDFNYNKVSKYIINLIEEMREERNNDIK